jgi:predicted helicase
MGYRKEFEILLEGIFESIKVRRIDHDAKAIDGNKPDFIVHKFNIPILYIEVKDIGIDLNKVEKSDQMARYYGYTNLILTDYVEFRFYRHGIPYCDPIKIANYEIKKRIIEPIPLNYAFVSKTIVDFTESQKEPIRTGKHLSQIMGGKALRIRDNVRAFLSVESEKNASIKKVYDAIKKQLVHDLSLNSFADMYAQTLVYGLFVARYHDESPDNFTRREARDLVPASNPLLKHFFDHIVGTDFDKRLEFIVDELCEVFLHSNVQELMKEYYKIDLWEKKHEAPDPAIHFYEDFLKEYDPELRKKIGAFYTPLPVVRFIVRSVDYILQKEFVLPSGLADSSKLPNGKHRVQVLDPAAGTGTFITEVLNNIYSRFTGDQKGRWPKYVLHDLLPRIHGFEIMMAPYTIAHLKLSMFLKDKGFKYFNDSRLGIYLTNSLEESNIRDDLFSGEFGFAGSIAEESREASKIKNQTPIMVVLGNPPYSVSSSNKGEWIQNLIDVYKKDMDERNIQPLSDDYIKFIRFAEHFIEKNKSGIVAMITNNSFLDGIIHRQMRKHLLETFDDIYILDLHGNSKKKEKSLDGSKDENVFNIMQGVSINILIKTGKEKTQLGNLYHSELYGLRDYKFESLNKSDIHNIKWNKLNYIEPYYFFVPKDFGENIEYEKGFKINELFKINTSGVKTHHDDELVSFNKFEDNNYQYYYRPFDTRWIEYDLNKVIRHRFSVMKHMIKENISLLTCKQQSSFAFQHVLVARVISDICSVSLQTKESTYAFPLYLYSEDGTKIPNLNQEIVTEIEKTVGKTTPEDILDYIYAVLHSPTYREKYKEFLKIDFPRVPYPKDKDTFKKLVALGNELRSLHLLESPKVNRYITSYPIEGTDTVEKITLEKTSPEKGNVYINQTQYFGGVPEIAWTFFIGGYQPAQKWLKDRKGRTLTNEDIEHYQKIIVSLSETHRIMSEINNINF